MIKVLADKNLYKIEQLIPQEATLTIYNPDEGLPDLRDFDALLVRTVTRLNEKSVPELPQTLSFVGTGSSGSDHIDIGFLKKHHVHVADAKGCNARAVAEYVLTALLIWRETTEFKNFGRIGIIGAGKTGTAVIRLLEIFGIEYVAYDPPREKKENGFSSASLEEVLSCDILTFHAPYVNQGAFPTKHWLNEEKLTGRTFKLVINASRGGVINELDLMKAYIEKRVENYILDVWENEPDFNPEIAKHAFIATPHIAGYSEQAKLNATQMVCEKMAHHFGIKNSLKKYKSIPQKVDLAYLKYDFKDLITRLHPILEYDHALRDLAHREDKAALFRMLRTDRPYRFEYPFLKIRKEVLDRFEELKKLGVKAI